VIEIDEQFGILPSSRWYGTSDISILSARVDFYRRLDKKKSHVEKAINMITGTNCFA